MRPTNRSSANAANASSVMRATSRIVAELALVLDRAQLLDEPAPRDELERRRRAASPSRRR